MVRRAGVSPKPARGLRARSPCVLRWRVVMLKTIRGQILLAFLAMGLVTAALGLNAVNTLRHEVSLIDRTYDQSLMSINYARAAAADFNSLQAAHARRLLTSNPAVRGKLDTKITELEASVNDDLVIASERAQSSRAIVVAGKVDAAMKAWSKARALASDGSDTDASWRAVDDDAAAVGQQIELLINYTAGDGFTFRQAAHRTVQADSRFSFFMTLLALVVLGSIAWFLARRIVVAIKKASIVAKRIAAGDLDVIVPAGDGDELGALLMSMDIMRGNIKTSMDREVELRRSAQTRLADALESSSDGVVVIDPDNKIALVNPQASLLLAMLAGPLQVGAEAEPYVARLAQMPGGTLERLAQASMCEAELPGGRWLRISQNTTRDGGSIIVCSDTTLIKAQQAALKATNLWLDSALANLSQGLCLFDSGYRLRVFNAQFRDLFGLREGDISHGMSLETLVTRSFAASKSRRSVRAFLDKVMARIEGRQPVTKLLRMDDGRLVVMSHRPLEDGSWLATYEDVTERMQAQEKIAFMARHDALTGLPNRALFAERVDSALIAAKGGQPFALLCLDLDHFKQVNDTLGHPFGDELLRAVATCLKGCLQDSDMVARLGGDEFAIVQPIFGGVEEASILARRISKALAAPFEIEGHRISVGVSIGISLAPADGTSYGKLLKNADVALYKAKADGRNTWRYFESEMDEQLQARRLLELDLREAIEKDQLELHYQPIFDVVEHRVSGVEALVRWRHPGRGLVPPSAFIPLAEEIGFITHIGDWVLKRACRDAASWAWPITVAVNVSAAQFREGRLVAKVIETLFDTGLPASRLDLEITESVLLTNNAPTLVALNQLRELGIKISMDDFGTGYSSLSYLRSFPFDKVKIDRSFTCDVCTNAEASAIARTIIALCRSLGMRTIAEGVENEEQLAFLRAEQCHEAQGFLFSHPVPAARLPGYLESLREGEPAARPLAVVRRRA